MIRTLNSPVGAEQSVRRLLSVAQRDRAKLALEVATGAHTLVMTTTIEQVRDDDFVISQPVIGALTHPLAFGEDIKIGFVHSAVHYSGHSRCLGRIKIPSGGSGKSGRGEEVQVLYAYRLTLPDSFRAEDRRAEPRVQVGLAGPIEAQLYAPSADEGPVLGNIVDISMAGARIITQSISGRIGPGRALYLKAMLPEPAGLLDELVNVVRVDCDSRTGQCTIGLRFQRRVEALERLLRASRHVA